MGKRARLAAAFHEFDSDCSGTLDRQELRAILARPGTGHSLADEDIDELLQFHDDNEDGVLQLEEFIELMLSLNDEDDDDDDDGGGEQDQPSPPPSPAAASSSSSEPPPPEGWLEMELGAALGQCKAHAPYGTELDLPMITGPDGAFVLTMEEAGEDCLEELEAAVSDFTETYDGVSNVVRTPLADGYIFTATNEPETRYGTSCSRRA